MRSDLIGDLADCTEFRLALQAQPPRIVHGTLLMLAALLAMALGWVAATQADLVVRAPGRVRPMTSPMKVVRSGGEDAVNVSVSSRVVEVHVHEGQEVRRGDVMIRLDTERLDNEITKRQRAIQAGEDELAELGRMEQLLAYQGESTRAKAEAELVQGREEVRQTTGRQAAEVRLAELEWQNTHNEEAQVWQLVERRFAARDDLRKATARVNEAREKLDKARLPVDTGRVEVLRRALELVAKDYAVRRQELHTKRGGKRAAVEALRIELANLELERKQAVIRAPMDGVVTTGDVKVGDILERGKPVVEIAEQQGFRFEAAVLSEEVGHLQAGMPARIRLDAYDYQRYGTVAGTVVFVSPDSGVPTGQGTATYLVRIELAGDELGRGELRGRVKLGMVQAEIVTGQESLLALLVKRLRQTISLG